MNHAISVVDGIPKSTGSDDLVPDPAYCLISIDGSNGFSTRRDGIYFPGLGVLFRETCKPRKHRDPFLSISHTFIPGAKLIKNPDGGVWTIIADRGEASGRATPLNK